MQKLPWEAVVQRGSRLEKPRYWLDWCRNLLSVFGPPMLCCKYPHPTAMKRKIGKQRCCQCQWISWPLQNSSGSDATPPPHVQHGDHKKGQCSDPRVRLGASLTQGRRRKGLAPQDFVNIRFAWHSISHLVLLRPGRRLPHFWCHLNIALTWDESVLVSIDICTTLQEGSRNHTGGSPQGKI